MTAGDVADLCQLDTHRSRAVASGLRARGVRAGDLVVATARSVDLVASIIGILRAGAAYVPLDLTNRSGGWPISCPTPGVGVVLTDASSSAHPLWEAAGDGVVVADVADLISAPGLPLMIRFPLRCRLIRVPT